MKKILGVLFILVALLCAGTLLYFISEEAGKPIVDVLPADTLAYLQVTNFRKNAAQIAATPFWRELSKVDFSLLMDEAKIPPDLKDTVNAAAALFRDPAAYNLIMKTIGKDFAFGVSLADVKIEKLAAVTSRNWEDMLGDILAGASFVVRLPSRHQPVDTIMKLVSKYTVEIVTEKEQVGDYTIHSITNLNNDTTVSFVQIEDLIVLGIDDKPARRSIDVAMGRAPSLADSMNFGKVQKGYIAGAALRFYLNVEEGFTAVRSEFDKIIDAAQANYGMNSQEAARVSQSVSEIFKNINGFVAVGTSMKMDDAMSLKFDMHVNPDFLEDNVVHMMTCAPGKNRTIAFVPRDVMGYQWNNCFSLPGMVDQLKEKAEQAKTGSSEAGADKISKIEQMLGAGADSDILSVIGDEVGGFLLDVTTIGMFPFPQIVLFVEIEDRNKADALLAQLTQNPMFMLQEETYGKATIRYINLPIIAGLAPAYGYVDSYLLIAIDKQLIHQAIDALNDPALSLVKNDALKAVGIDSGAQSRGIQFLKVDSMAGRLKGLVEAGNKWITAQDEKREAFRSGQNLRLKELQDAYLQKYNQLTGLTEAGAKLQAEIDDLKEKGGDISMKQQILERQKGKITAQKTELDDLQAQIKSIGETIEGQVIKDPQSRRVFINQVIDPFIAALQTINAYGSVSTVEKNVFQTLMQVDLHE